VQLIAATSRSSIAAPLEAPEELPVVAHYELSLKTTFMLPLEGL